MSLAGVDGAAAAVISNISNADYSTPLFTNSNNDGGDLELSRFSPEMKIFAGVMTVLMMVCGILGNSLTILALLKSPKIRSTVSAIFIISLCVADLIFCVAVLPFSSSRFLNGGWIHGDTLCQVFPYMRYGNVGVSLLSIAMITINRYVMIAHHTSSERIYSHVNVALMIVFCWGFSYGMLTPTLLGYWGEFGHDLKLGSCTIVPDANGRSAKTALFIIAFIVPCIIIIICYTRIFWVVHSSEVRMKKHSTAPKARDDKLSKRKRNEWRITQMVLAIFLSYVVCYLPITITKVTDEEVNYPGFHIMGYLLLYFSACVNPIIYVIMNKQYRQAYLNVFTGIRPGASSYAPGAHLSSADKSRDGQSRTMISQVSFALSTLQAKDREQPYNMPNLFEDNEKL